MEWQDSYWHACIGRQSHYDCRIRNLMLTKHPMIKSGFIYACYRGHTEVVRLLLHDLRTDINKGDKNGRTGFMISIIQKEMDIASLIVRHSPEMHRGWWEMRVGYLCRQLTSHTFIDHNDELSSLFNLWKGLFTYTTIQEEHYSYPWRRAILRSRGVWKRELSEERWREGCDVMREKDTIAVLSLFFYSQPHCRTSQENGNPYACRVLTRASFHLEQSVTAWTKLWQKDNFVTRDKKVCDKRYSVHVIIINSILQGKKLISVLKQFWSQNLERRKMFVRSIFSNIV